MPRTRDLMVFVSTVLLLVGGIGVSLVHNSMWAGVSGHHVAAIFVTTELGEVEVVGAPVSEPDRSSLLASMREKVAIAMRDMTAVFAPEPNEGSVTDSSVTGDGLVNLGEPASEDGVVWECAGYGPDTPPSLAGMDMAVVEGVRVWTVPATTVASVVSTFDAGSTTLPEAVLSPIVIPPVLQLPVRTAPAGNPSCIPSEVVGVARDGSYIRNSEIGLYGVFGAETLVGYALDGFPIYGVNDDAVVDRCGGMVVGGEYRYFLKSNQKHLLSCFAAPPVEL